MAWRGFRFGIRHSLRDAGYSSVSVANTVATGDYLTFLFDERREAMAFTGAAANHHIQVDLGTGYASVTVDRMFIPLGHNYDTYDLRVREDDNSGMSSATTLYSVTPHSGTALIDVTLTESSERYIRTDWITDNFNPSTPELWLTKTLTPTAGPDFKWGDSYVHNVRSMVTEAGDRGDVQRGASQRVFELEYPYVDVAADIAMLDQLVEDVGMDQAFLLDPPFDDEDVLICKMAREPERTFAHSAPNSGSGSKAYRYRFTIIEQLV
jgi:hypothetical protein